MSKTLDRNRPFGEIWGGDGGAKYEQDNLLFDGQGNEIVAEASQEPKRRGGRPHKAAVSDVDSQIEASMAIE